MYSFCLLIQGKDYVLHVVAPNFPSMEKCSLSGCLDLKTALVNAGFKDENLDNVNGVEELVERVAGFIVSALILPALTIKSVYDIV